VNSLIHTLFESKHATQVKHPYIAEISSRCDSAGPPQRLDFRLTSSGVQSLLTPVAIQGVEAIVFSLKEALQFTGKVQWDTHLVLVLPGAPEQKFHVDSSRSWFYFTLIFPLSKDPPKAGKTEFWNKTDQPVVPAERGDVLVFDGRRKHRGSANATAKHVRVFLYIAVYSGTDWN
jgi:ectoine hydroxylase-related dioxygenase (phytanoyl-CoA dioxygenase family)